MKKEILFIAFVAFGMISSAEGKTTVHNPNAGGLCKVLSQEQFDTCTEIVLTGKLNSADIQLLRRMAGFRAHKDDKTGRLTYLDLSGARIISDKHPYLTVDAEDAHLYLYQKVVSTNPTADYFGTPTVRSNGRAEGHDVTTSAVVLGSYWDYKKNFAVLNIENEEDINKVKCYSSYKVTDNKKSGIQFQSMRHIKGHHLKKVDGQWQWCSHLRKDRFSFDMFYGCPNLKVVIFPNSDKRDSQVWVYNGGIQYYTKS